MATSTTAPLHVVPARPDAPAAAATARRTWIAPAAAAVLGAGAAVATTWWIVASQSLEMTMRTAGF